VKEIDEEAVTLADEQQIVNLDEKEQEPVSLSYQDSTSVLLDEQ